MPRFADSDEAARAERLRLVEEGRKKAEELEKRKEAEMETGSQEVPRVSAPTQAKRKRKAKKDVGQVELTPDEIEAQDEALALWIASSSLPISCVEHPNMHRYIATINPNVCIQFICRNINSYLILSLLGQVALQMEASEASDQDCQQGCDSHKVSYSLVVKILTVKV